MMPDFFPVSSVTRLFKLLSGKAAESTQQLYIRLSLLVSVQQRFLTDNVSTMKNFIKNRVTFGSILVAFGTQLNVHDHVIND